MGVARSATPLAWACKEDGGTRVTTMFCGRQRTGHTGARTRGACPPRPAASGSSSSRRQLPATGCHTPTRREGLCGSDTGDGGSDDDLERPLAMAMAGWAFSWLRAGLAGVGTRLRGTRLGDRGPAGWRLRTLGGMQTMMLRLLFKRLTRVLRGARLPRPHRSHAGRDSRLAARHLRWPPADALLGPGRDRGRSRLCVPSYASVPLSRPGAPPSASQRGS